MSCFKRLFWVLLVVIVPYTVCLSQNANKKESLRKQLWAFADEFIDSPEDELPDKIKELKDDMYISCIEDVSNGYLSLNYGDGPCGCDVKVCVGAFKLPDEYVFLKTTYAHCAQTHLCVPSKSWKYILPEEISMEYFYKKGEKINIDYSVFYIEVDIPQYGREVVFTTKLVPFGLNGRSMPGVMYTGYLPFGNESFLGVYPGEGPISYFKDCLPDKQFDRESYSPDDLNELALQVYEKYNNSSTTLDEVERAIDFMYKIYKEYQRINLQTITMEWNPAKGHFEIKKVEKHKQINSFLDFLRLDNYWVQKC